MTPLYFDYAATTPVDPLVAAAMQECLTLEGNFGNPASRSHKYGWRAEQAVEKARAQLAQCLCCDPREIVFTSGATESNNLALKGVIEHLQQQNSEQKLHVISSAIEHKAVLDVLAWLSTHYSVEITYLTPDADGVIAPEQVAAALQDNTCLVSLMAVNNELGTITDVAAIARLLADHPALFHVDGAQAVGKVALNVRELGIDLLSVSAHKFYGPKGIGALYVRQSVKIAAQIHGGGHERGMRSGTLATHQIVGMGTAAQLVNEQGSAEIVRLQELQQQLWQGLQSIGGVHLNGHATQRTAQHLNVSIEGVDGEILLASLAKLAVSSGSACNSATVAPSYVLKAIGRSDALAHAGLRFSLGRFTTEAEIQAAVAEVQRVVALLRPKAS